MDISGSGIRAQNLKYAAQNLWCPLVGQVDILVAICELCIILTYSRERNTRQDERPGHKVASYFRTFLLVDTLQRLYSS